VPFLQSGKCYEAVCLPRNLQPRYESWPISGPTDVKRRHTWTEPEGSTEAAVAETGLTGVEEDQQFSPYAKRWRLKSRFSFTFEELKRRERVEGGGKKAGRRCKDGLRNACPWYQSWSMRPEQLRRIRTVHAVKRISTSAILRARRFWRKRTNAIELQDITHVIKRTWRLGKLTCLCDNYTVTCYIPSTQTRFQKLKH
jgi:hypothetical protein